MANAQRRKYRVADFGVHVDFKMLEFIDEIEDSTVCSYCGIVRKESYVLSCLHVACQSCYELKLNPKVCLIDRRKAVMSRTGYLPEFVKPYTKRVRCPNADSGCGYTGHLYDLDDHLNRTCDFHLTTCVRCQGAVVFKDMTQHYPFCKGHVAETVVLAAADARSLLQDFGNARNELQRALDSTTTDGGDELRAAVASLSENFARLQSQLAVPDADTVASGLSRPEK